jgi:hypothetical protein
MANEHLMCEEGEYHAMDGVFFKRVEDGAVRLRWPGGEVALPPGMWASAVANVSAPGETAEQYAAAALLHEGQPQATIVKARSLDTLILRTDLPDSFEFHQSARRMIQLLARSGFRALVLPRSVSVVEVLRGPAAD